MSTGWVLTIIAGLFGGLDIFQFFFWRSEQKKHNAEAAAAEADAKQKNIDMQQDQFDYLLTKLSEFQKSYYDVVKQLQDSIEEKTALKKEISELKGTVEAQNRKISELQKEIEKFSKKFSQKPATPKKSKTEAKK